MKSGTTPSQPSQPRLPPRGPGKTPARVQRSRVKEEGEILGEMAKPWLKVLALVAVGAAFVYAIATFANHAFEQADPTNKPAVVQSRPGPAPPRTNAPEMKANADGSWARPVKPAKGKNGTKRTP